MEEAFLKTVQSSSNFSNKFHSNIGLKPIAVMNDHVVCVHTRGRVNLPAVWLSKYVFIYSLHSFLETLHKFIDTEKYKHKKYYN